MNDYASRLRLIARRQTVPSDEFERTLYGAANEIERLREALRHYVSECDCNGGTYHEDDHITGKTLVKDCPKCEPARAALEQAQPVAAREKE